MGDLWADARDSAVLREAGISVREVEGCAQAMVRSKQIALLVDLSSDTTAPHIGAANPCTVATRRAAVDFGVMLILDVEQVRLLGSGLGQNWGVGSRSVDWGAWSYDRYIDHIGSPDRNQSSLDVESERTRL